MDDFDKSKFIEQAKEDEKRFENDVFVATGSTIVELNDKLFKIRVGTNKRALSEMDLFKREHRQQVTEKVRKELDAELEADGIDTDKQYSGVEMHRQMFARVEKNLTEMWNNQKV